MATATIRPNGTVSSGSWTATGAASHHAAQSDNSDSTYSRFNNVTQSRLTLDFDTVAIPAGAQIKSVQLRFRGLWAYTLEQGAGWAGGYLRYNGVDGGQTGHDNANYGTTITTVTGPALTSAPGGVAWSQAVLDALQFSILLDVTTTETLDFNLYEVYADVVYNEAPVVTVTGPTEGTTITTTSQPTGTITYSDPESNACERQRWKVFAQSVYTAGGFDPETSETVWDSGELFTSVLDRQIGTPLGEGTYRLYVKAADAGSGGRYGNWDFNTFTIQVNVPAVPLVSFVADDTDLRTTLTIQGRVNRLTTNQSSLETDTTGWFAQQNCTIARSTAQFYDGAASLELTSTANATIAAITPESDDGFRVVAGETLSAIAYCKAGTTSRAFDMYVHFYDSSGAYLGGGTVLSPSSRSIGTTWTPIQVTGTAPANAFYAAFAVEVRDTLVGEKFYFDAMAVTPGTINMLTPDQASLETSTTGWEVDSNCTIARSTAVTAIDGGAVLAVTSAAAGDMQVGTSEGTSGVAVTGSSTWTFIAHVRSASVARLAHVGVDFYSSSGTWLGWEDGASVTTTTTGWTKLTLTYTFGSTIRWCRVFVVVHGTGGASEVHYVDAVAVQAGTSTTYVSPRPWTEGGFGTTQRVAVERSEDNGATWTLLTRLVAGAGTTVDADGRVDVDDVTQAATVHDYEAAFGQTVLYRVRSYATAVGLTRSSATSIHVSGASYAQPDEWVLKDLYDPTLTVGELDIQLPIKSRRKEAQSVKYPLGRSRPVVVRDALYGEEYALVLDFLDDASFDAFEALRGRQSTLLLQGPFGDHRYVSLGAARDLDFVYGGDPSVRYRRVSIDVTEVDRPA